MSDQCNFVTRRQFCLWALAGAQGFVAARALGAGESLEAARREVSFSADSVLCRNPAFRVCHDFGQTCLTTTAKQGQRIAFGVDVGGLSVWNALPELTDIEAGRGRTFKQVVDLVVSAFPGMSLAQVREGVRAFIEQAMAAGVVLPTNKQMFCQMRMKVKGS